MVVWTNNENDIVDELNKLSIFTDNQLTLEGKSYSSFDAFNNSYVCEIKKRNFTSDHRFALEGLIIEKIKYDGLLSKCSKICVADKEALYINKFTDNKILIWNLSEMTNTGYNFNWHMKKMNKRTFESKWNKTEKEVALLKLKEARKYG
jgi:hypothetical protein